VLWYALCWCLTRGSHLPLSAETNVVVTVLRLCLQGGCLPHVASFALLYVWRSQKVYAYMPAINWWLCFTCWWSLSV